MAAIPESRFASLSRRLGLEPDEMRTLALMGALVGVLFCAYTIAKVLRDALFLAEFGALALPYAYVGVALVSAGFVWLEGAVEQRFTNTNAARLNQYLAIAIGIVLAITYKFDRHWTAAALYLWTGSQAMLLLSHFWVLALDVWDSRRARRVFPMLSGCGLIGGLAGGGIAAWVTPLIKRDGLIWVLTVLLFAAHLLTRRIERQRAHRPRTAGIEPQASRWTIILRSSYIKVLVAGLALAVIVGTLVDFQFKYFIQRMYPDPHALAQFLGMFYFGLNALALVFQFGVAGWLLQRIGLSASTGLQPTTVLVFASWMALGTGGWGVVAMRWVQGVVFQTLGKSSAEIYYAAIRPNERRRIKPAIDTLVERWSDAAVGLMLIVALYVLHVPIATIGIVTGILAAVWLAVLLLLDRQYGRAFEVALSKRWIEPEQAAESMRIPSARRAVLEALRCDDEHRIVLALGLSGQAHDPTIFAAVRKCLLHSSPTVRAAAIGALEGARNGDPEGTIERSLDDPNEAVRRASVSYLLARGSDPVSFARRLLEGDDSKLRRHVVEELQHHGASRALTRPWVEARISSADPEDRQLAALALGILPGVPVEPLRGLLADPDADVRRAALTAAARRPSRDLLDALLPLLLVPELAYEARTAVAALGDAAIPSLAPLLAGEQGPHGQAVAGRALARIASARAIAVLMPLVRSRDVWLRHLGLQALSQMRLSREQPVLSKTTAHALFLRELNDYRVWLEPARLLATHPAPEVRLLGESYQESAEMALERGLQALACRYEPRPLFGAFERLRSKDPELVTPALEYLSHTLPRRVFRPVSLAFEGTAVKDPSTDLSESVLADWIRTAWESDDAWLRACAVRASRYCPRLDTKLFAEASDLPAIVRDEITARRVAIEPGSARPRIPAGWPRLEPKTC